MEPVEEIRSSIEEMVAQKRRPMVTLTYAQSLDGSIAARPGAPLAVSCEETKLLTHRLRAAHDGILVGIGTVLADDPKLTARRVGGPHPRPVILDGRLRTPPNAKVIRHPRGVVIATSENADAALERDLRARGAEIVRLPAGDGGLSLTALLRRLGEMGIRSVMVEGGTSVLTSFLRAGLVDWVLVTIAPRFVGGVRAIAALPPADAASVEPFPGLGDDWRCGRFARDMVVWGRFVPGNSTERESARTKINAADRDQKER